MSKIGLIIQREYSTRVRKTSFIVMTVLGPLLMAGLISFILWMALRESQEQRILVVDQTYGAFSELKNYPGLTFDHFAPEGIPPERIFSSAEKVFANSGYTAILFIPRVLLEGSANSKEVRVAQLFFKKQPNNFIQNAIETQVESLAELAWLDRLYKDGTIDPEKFSINTYKKIKVDVMLQTFKFTEDGGVEEVFRDSSLVGMTFGILIHLFILIYGLMVMRGVIEEKTSRIVEVIVSSVKPFQLMLGKIIGIGLVALTQFMLWILLTGTIVLVVQVAFFPDMYDSANLEENTQMTREVLEQMMEEEASQAMNPNNPNHLINNTNFPFMISLFIFYFIGGYLLYSSMFAAVGAAVDSETDTQQFMIPVTIPLTLAYFIAVTLIFSPDTNLAFWFSIIPFTSPIVMLVRASGGIGGAGVYPWEILLSMALLIAAFLLMTWISAKIYRTGILMYGKRISYRELWKWIRY